MKTPPPREPQFQFVQGPAAGILQLVLGLDSNTRLRRGHKLHADLLALDGAGRNLALRFVGGAAFMLILAGLALSLSRGGFLAAAGALLVMLTWRPFRYAAVGALLVVIAFQVTSAATLSGEVQQTSVVAGRVQSVSYAASGGDPRFAIWRTTPQMIAAHPFFGIGENQYPEVSVRYGLYAEDLGGSYQHAHNIPLTIAAETGLLGLAALVWVAVALARVLIGACRRMALGNAGQNLAALGG